MYAAANHTQAAEWQPELWVILGKQIHSTPFNYSVGVYAYETFVRFMKHSEYQ